MSWWINLTGDTGAMRILAGTRKALIGLASMSGAVLFVAALASAALLRLSLPRLEGEVKARGLSAPVSVERDAQGASTFSGRSRSDLAWALGYLHAQERFFQMDLQRRSAAGELSELVGPAALPADRAARLHRFRHRAAAVLAAITPGERKVLDAYVAGVNRGLGDLSAPPFEYLLLVRKPQPWLAEDFDPCRLRDVSDAAGAGRLDRAATRRRDRMRSGSRWPSFCSRKARVSTLRWTGLFCRRRRFPRKD